MNPQRNVYINKFVLVDTLGTGEIESDIHAQFFLPSLWFSNGFFSFDFVADFED